MKTLYFEESYRTKISMGNYSYFMRHIEGIISVACTIFSRDFHLNVQAKLCIAVINGTQWPTRISKQDKLLAGGCS